MLTREGRGCGNKGGTMEQQISCGAGSLSPPPLRVTQSTIFELV